MITKDSRNTLTSVIQTYSAITGLPIGQPYLDLRERAAKDPYDDRAAEVQDNTTSPAIMASLALNDPRFWWVIMDVSDVVDPFELKAGDSLRVPTSDRLFFDILDNGREDLLWT